MTSRTRTLIVGTWLAVIERAVSRGDGSTAGLLTRQYVHRCRELGLLGPTVRAPREDVPPYERPDDGEVPVTLPTVTARWQKRSGWGS